MKAKRTVLGMILFGALAAASAAFAQPKAQGSAGGVFTRGEFYTGCNYWASNAGMYMWRRWDPKAVEKRIATAGRIQI